MSAEEIFRFVRYMEILHLDEFVDIPVDFGRKFYVQEKIDGSNFRFALTRDGKRYFGSKNVDFKDGVVEKMFSLAVENANKFLDVLGRVESDVIFFAEYLAKPKQNTLVYGRVPKGNLILFDVIVDGKYQDYEAVKEWAERMGMEVVPVLDILEKPISEEEARKYFDTESCLGGCKIEGVVVKSYDSRIYMRNRIFPYMVKIVKPEFKELNRLNWRQNIRPGEKEILEKIMGMFNLENVYQKAYLHARDGGELKGEMSDLACLFRHLNEDIEKEYRDAIKEELWQYFRSEIRRRLGKGLPEWYKRKLGEMQA